MRKSILLCFVAVFCFACQEQVNIEKEKEAIIKVLKEEVKTFADYDMDKLSALHVQDSLDTRLAGTKLYKGWGEIEVLLEGYMERNKKDTVSENVRNEKDNLIIKVTGKTAWAIMDNIWKWEEGGETKDVSNYQISFFEKIDGDWKFSFNAFVANSQEE